MASKPGLSNVLNIKVYSTDIKPYRYIYTWKYKQGKYENKSVVKNDYHLKCFKTSEYVIQVIIILFH